MRASTCHRMSCLEDPSRNRHRTRKPAHTRRLQDAGPVRPGRRAGILRLHHLHLLRDGAGRAVLSAGHTGLDAAVADLRHLCCRLPHPSAGRNRDGALRRPARSQAHVRAEHRIDGLADAGHRRAADLCADRPGRPALAADDAVAAGRGHRRRSSQCMGLRRRARACATQGTGLRNTDRWPGRRGVARFAQRRGDQSRFHAAGNRRRRLAPAVFGRRPLRPAFRVSAALAARNAGIRGADGDACRRARNAAQAGAARSSTQCGAVVVADLDGGSRGAGGVVDDADAAAERVPLPGSGRLAGQPACGPAAGDRLDRGRRLVRSLRQRTRAACRQRVPGRQRLAVLSPGR